MKEFIAQLRLKSAFALVFSMHLLATPVTSQAQNSECASNGGDAQCVDPIITKDWSCMGTFIYADSNPCGLIGSGVICRTEDEAIQQAIDNYMEVAQDCDEPSYGPLCPGPGEAERFTYHYGKLVGAYRNYVATNHGWVGGVCTAHVVESCGAPSGPFYGSVGNCVRTAQCPPGSSSPSVDLPCKTYKSEVCPRGNPFDCVTGQKMQTEVDISARSDDALAFTRYYSSSGFYAPVGADAEYEPGAEPRNLGVHWRHTYQRRVYREPASTTEPPMATVARPDGDYRHFKQVAGQWVGRADKPETLAELFDTSHSVGWIYVSSDNVIEEFDEYGRLVRVTKPSGLILELAYSTATTPIAIAPYAGLLISVTSSSGRQLRFIYDSTSSLIEVSDDAGVSHIYAYDADGTLQFVTQPGGSIREYRYNESEHTAGTPIGRALTGIIDENGQRYGTYQYSNSKVTKEWHGSSFADQLQLTNTSGPNPPYYARTTGALGNFEQIEFISVNGVIREKGRKRCSTQNCTAVLAQTANTYDTSGNIDTRTDDNGVLTEYDYDAGGREARRTEAANASGANASAKRTIETDWHASFNAPTERRSLNAAGLLEAKSQWTYNTRGQAIARCEIDPGDAAAMAYTCSATTAPSSAAKVRRWVTTYCEQADVTAGTCPRIGLVKSVNGPRSSTDPGMGSLDDVAVYTYYQTDDATCASDGACPHRRGDLWKVTDALGHVTEYVRYDRNGRIERIKDANGTYTDFFYHIRGWLTDRIVRAKADGTPFPLADAALHIDYDAVGNVIRVVQPDASSLEYAYDDAHRLLRINDNQGNTIDYCPGVVGSADCLDAAGNRRVEQIKDPSGNVKRQLHRVYNELGQLIQTLNASGQPVECADSTANVLCGISDGYDGNGNRVLSEDGFGTVTRQEYDPLDRLKATIQNVAGINPATADTTTEYTYDTRDNLRQVTDPDGLNTVYDYDGLNNLTGLHSPDTGDAGYVYDKAGNRTSQTDARGITSSYTYDALNRLISITYPTVDLDVSYAYDQPDAATGCSGSFPKGRLTQMGDAAGSTTYCYDRRGNLTRKSQAAKDQATLVTHYSYTLADRLASITYPSGAVVTYTRDAVGRVQAVSWKANELATPIPLISTAAYVPFGPLTTLTFGNGRTLNKAYDQDYAIDAISGTPTGALTLDFAVDVMGNITRASDTLNPFVPDRAYKYDPLYRLTAAQTGTTPSASLEGYTYNPTGDRTSASLNGGPAETYAYTANTHRLASVGATARSYDANGNTRTGLPSGMTLTYDDRNRLSMAHRPLTTALYTHNGRGERVRKLFNNGLFATTTRYGYDESGQLLGEYDDAGTAQAEYVYLDSTPIAVIKDATPYYIETDHLGTPRQVVSPATNTVIWQWDLLESTFGANAPEEDPDNDGIAFEMNLRFPGQYFDAETGLNYNYFRDYEAGTGRYNQPDPIGFDGGVSAYGYAGANPLRYIDPYGLFFDEQQFAKLCLRTAAPAVGVATGLAGLAVAVGVLVPSPLGSCDEPIPPSDSQCPNYDDLCAKAIRDAESAYRKLITKRIPQYQSGGTRGRDVGHYDAIVQLQRALRDALRRVRRYCRTLPPELTDWERVANSNGPGF